MRFLLTLLVFAQFGVFAQEKIPLDKEMVVNITGWGDAELLIDEQDAAGDPAAGKGGEVHTRWLPGWKNWFFPSSAVIDLKTEYEINEVWLHNGKGRGSISVHSGSLKKWKYEFTDELRKFKEWSGHKLQARCRYLMVTIDEKGAVPEEIVIYGKRIGEEPEEPLVTEHSRPFMKDFIGINGFPDDPVEVSRVSKFVREYHNWNWNEQNKGEYRFSPGYPDWDFDEYYRLMKEAGIVVAPCLKQSPSWMTAHKEHKPLPAGRDPLNPHSYREKSRYMFQYAARYGSRKVDEKYLLVQKGQKKKTGLNYIKYYEDWNEPDMWWHGREGYFLPLEYAAMASANCDGHKGSMGPGYGIKTADPDAIMVMAGLATMSINYLKAIKLWSQTFRGDDFPADVINLHHYCNDMGGQKQSTTGISPEDDGFKERVEKFVEYRNKYLSGKDIWITEFGYDVNQKSIQRAPAIGQFSGEEVQAIWLIRSYLALAAAGADKAAMYMVRDDGNPDTTSRFVTSGLMEGKNVRRRVSWYYLKTFGNILGDCVFEREVNTAKNDIKNYKFVNPGTGDLVYVLWCPTSEGKVVDDYSFVLPVNTKSYSVISLKHKSEAGDKRIVNAKGKKVKLKVSEKPVFVVVKSDN